MNDRELLSRIYHIPHPRAHYVFFARDQADAEKWVKCYNKDPGSAPGIRVCNRPTDGITPDILGWMFQQQDGGV